MPGAFDLILATGPAVLVFAAIFIAGQRIHPLRGIVRERRDVVSFSAGMSAAYVFVHMMPELAEAREVVVELVSDAPWLLYEGVAIYFLAMLGFLCFYGLDRYRSRHPAMVVEAGGEARGEVGRAMHIGGTAVYVGLMSYLLVRSAGDSVAATVGFTLAFGGHFLALDHALCEEYENEYLGKGRWLMAGSCVVGWAAGILLALPPFALALLIAFISGGVIMTNALMELSEGKDGRFVAFMSGSLIYGLILVPIG